MPLIPAKCTECGSILQTDNSKDVTVCPHCGTPFIIDKAITNYSISVQMNGGTVINNEDSPERLLENAEIFRKLGELKKALNCYDTVSSRFPAEWRSWWGRFSVETDDGKKISEITEELPGGLAAERASAAGAPDSVKAVCEKYKNDTSEWTMAVRRLREEKEELSKAEASELNEKLTERKISRDHVYENLAKHNSVDIWEYYLGAIVMIMPCFMLLWMHSTFEGNIFSAVFSAGYILVILMTSGRIGIGLFRKKRQNRLDQEVKDLDKAINDIKGQLAAMKTKEHLLLKDILENPQVRKVYNRLIDEGKTPSLKT